MVSAFIQKLTQETYSMHKAALLIAALSLVAQLLAVVRDKMLAHYFGAGGDLSLYYAAFRIPDMVYASLASVMAAIIILPILTAAYEVSLERAQKVMYSLLTVFTMVIVVCCTVLYFFMPELVLYIAPGFSLEQHVQLTLLSRILLLSPIILGISNLIGSVLQMKKNFFMYSLAPVFYNVGIILGIVMFSGTYGILGVVYGVIFGGLLHIGIQIPAAYVYKLIPWYTFSIDWKLIREVFFIALPRIATLGAIQITQTFLVAQATYIALGSVAVFTLAFNVQTVPLTLIGLSYSVAAFPVIAEYVQKKQFENLWGSVASAIRHIIFWSVPVTCFVIVLRAHIIRLLYGSGAFDWTDTRLTAAVLAVMVIALAAQGVSLLLMRALYALKHAYTQLVAQIIAFGVTYLIAMYGMAVWKKNLVVQYFFENLFRVNDIPDTSILMLGLAYMCGAVTLTIFLWVVLRIHVPFARFAAFRRVLVFSFGASITGAFLTYTTLTVLSPYVNLDTFVGVALHAIFAFIPGAIAWFWILYILGSVELHEFIHALKKRFWKTDIVQGELQEL